jgi:hypothetical protein
MPWIAAIGAMGGMAGTIAQQGEFDQARMDQQAALALWMQQNVPDPAQQQLFLQKYQQTGKLDPQIEQAMQQQGTNLDKISTDPSLQQAQMKALGQLQSEGLSGGLGLQDQATYQQQVNDANAAAKGRAGSIQDSMQARGMGDSGLGLVAQMQNAQNANQTQAQSSLQAAADARQRALQSIQGSGSLAGQMQQQQYSQKANAAQAQDAINRFNTQNMQGVNQRNVDRSNEAQKGNLTLQQDVANKNTDLSNYQQQYNKNLYQQQYQNQMQKVSGATGQYNQNAQTAFGMGNQLANTYGKIGSSLSKAGSAWANDNSNDDEEE